MDPEKKDETTDSGSQSQQQSSEQPTRSKLRDLKPEKDPMGAGRGELSAGVPRIVAE